MNKAQRMQHRTDGYWVYFGSMSTAWRPLPDMKEAREWCEHNLAPETYREGMRGFLFKNHDDAMMCYIRFK